MNDQPTVKIKSAKNLKSRLTEHLNVLCNVCKERHSGSTGELKAAKYIFNKFREYGLEAVDEYFPSPGWRYGKYSFLSSGRKVKLNCFPCYFSNPCDVSGKITVIESPERIDHYDLAGKICLVLLDIADGSGIGSRNNLAEMLDARGAAVMIVTGRFHQTVDTKIIRTPRLKQMAVMTIPTEELWKIAANCNSRFRIKIRAERFEYRARNVIDRINGNGKYKVVIGAHYDTAPGTVGACDDASGTATLLEMARRLKARPGFPWGIAVDFVAFSGEEYGGPGKALGSFEYVRAHTHRGELDNILWMCNMDDVGVALAKDSVHVSRSWRLKEDIRKIVEPLGIRVMDANPSSDNVAFFHNAIPDFWFYSKGSQMIHSPADVPGILDFDKMANICAAAVKTMSHLLKNNHFDTNRNIQ
ncbi:MAG: M28 family metallopeptidase [Verrucomicrobiota bacterium]